MMMVFDVDVYDDDMVVVDDDDGRRLVYVINPRAPTSNIVLFWNGFGL